MLPQKTPACFLSSFGKWKPREVIYDRLAIVDQFLIPTDYTTLYPVVNGIEGYVIIVGGAGIVTNWLGEGTYNFTQLMGQVLDQNGAVPQAPGYLPWWLNYTSQPGGVQVESFTAQTAVPIALAPGTGLYALGFASIAPAVLGDAFLVVWFAQVKLEVDNG